MQNEQRIINSIIKNSLPERPTITHNVQEIFDDSGLSKIDFANSLQSLMDKGFLDLTFGNGKLVEISLFRNFPK